MADGFCENTTVDEGIAQGIRTQLHFEGGDLIVQKTFDAEPHLQYAKEARLATQGMNWGDGRMIGHIPQIFYAQICAIRDRTEREKAVTRFFQENPAFIMFERFKA